MPYGTRQLYVHIARVLEKLHFFQFFNFLFIIYATYRKKKLHPFTTEKLHDWTICLSTTYIFHL